MGGGSSREQKEVEQVEQAFDDESFADAMRLQNSKEAEPLLNSVGGLSGLKLLQESTCSELRMRLYAASPSGKSINMYFVISIIPFAPASWKDSALI